MSRFFFPPVQIREEENQHQHTHTYAPHRQSKLWEIKISFRNKRPLLPHRKRNGLTKRKVVLGGVEQNKKRTKKRLTTERLATLENVIWWWYLNGSKKLKERTIL